VTAWATQGHEPELADIFSATAETLQHWKQSWTIERWPGLDVAHTAIRAAGFEPEGVPRRYYTEGGDFSTAPNSQLYTRAAQVPVAGINTTADYDPGFGR